MLHNRRAVLTGAVASAMTAAVAAPAWAASDEQDVVDHSIGTLQDLRHDKEFGNARSLLRRARAVVIAPRIIKAGFFFGGEGGQAVLLARGPNGWSDPAFYTVASASFGFQIGAQQSEMIMFVMSERALQALMRDQFKIGVNAGFAVVTLGSTVEGATTANVGPDIVVWASSSGAYAGVSLDGTLIVPKTDGDARYYGRPLSSADIVQRRRGRAPGASGLVRQLNSL